jgi:hypothetical protein
MYWMYQIELVGKADGLELFLWFHRAAGFTSEALWHWQSDAPLPRRASLAEELIASPYIYDAIGIALQAPPI